MVLESFRAVGKTGRVKNIGKNLEAVKWTREWSPEAAVKNVNESNLWQLNIFI